MAKKAMFTATSQTGTPINVYGELTPLNDIRDPAGNVEVAALSQVRVWSKYANYGFYNLERFENGTLTSKTLRKLMTGKD